MVRNEELPGGMLVPYVFSWVGSWLEISTRHRKLTCNVQLGILHTSEPCISVIWKTLQLFPDFFNKPRGFLSKHVKQDPKPNQQKLNSFQKNNLRQAAFQIFFGEILKLPSLIKNCPRPTTYPPRLSHQRTK